MPAVKNTIFLLLLCCISCRQKQQGAARNDDQAASADTATAADTGMGKSAFGPAGAVAGLPEMLKQFIPEGYVVLDTASGDLNLDASPDWILVLKQPDEDALTDHDAPKRPLLILTGTENGGYVLNKRNDHAVLCYNCAGMFGDAYNNITIKHGYFSIEYSIAGGQHWESVTTFKYDRQKADWFLYKEGYVSYRMNEDTSPDADALVKDVETQKTVKDFGIVPFEQYDTHTEQ